MVINNQKALTETRQFLEQNVTQDCNITLDSEMNLNCCEIVKKIQEWKYIYNFNGYACPQFYKCDKKNFHCVLNESRIMGFVGIIFVIVLLAFATCMCYKDLIRRKLNNLVSKLPRISRRTAENNSMEMNQRGEAMWVGPVL